MKTNKTFDLRNLIQIATLVLLTAIVGCQNNSTWIETPIIIEDQVFTLPENSPEGTLIGQVEVKNQTATNLKYYLVAGDYSSAFRMETSTGKLILKDSSLINYESIKQINLEVIVRYENSNKGYGVFANVLVKIDDKLETYTWIADVFSRGNQNAIVNSLQSNSNFDSVNYLFATAWTNNLQPTVIRSFLKFDLTGIPREVQITGATLSLYNPKDGEKEHEHSCFSGSNDFCIRKVTSKWDRQTITWNSQPTFTTDAQSVLPDCQTAQQDYENINITELIRYILKSPDENFGFVMMLENENYYRRLCFASFDYPDKTFCPKLEINYLK